MKEKANLNYLRLPIMFIYRRVWEWLNISLTLGAGDNVLKTIISGTFLGHLWKDLRVQRASITEWYGQHSEGIGRWHWQQCGGKPTHVCSLSSLVEFGFVYFLFFILSGSPSFEPVWDQRLHSLGHQILLCEFHLKSIRNYSLKLTDVEINCNL